MGNELIATAVLAVRWFEHSLSNEGGSFASILEAKLTELVGWEMNLLQ